MATYIGVDVGKKSLQVYLPTIDKSFDVTNNESGFIKLIDSLCKHYDRLDNLIIVFEPTGGYERNLREFLKSRELGFTTVHPNKVRNYAKAKGLFAKTDKIDSKLLSDYATIFSLQIKRCFKENDQQKLQELVKRREQLILFKTQEAARLDKVSDVTIESSLKEHLSYLERELESVSKAIANHCNDNPATSNLITKLTSIPGVGITLATTTICELPELGKIDLGKLTALVGLAPFARDSGNYRGRRSIFAGRSNLREVLYMASVASIRCNKRLKAFYDSLIANHKAPKVALVAVMRKLLSYMHALVKTNSVWSTSYAKS